MSLSLGEFTQEFAEWDLCFPKILYERIKAVCEKYDLTAEEFASSWQAFKQNRGTKIDLNAESLDSLVREIFEKEFSKKSFKTRSTPKINNSDVVTPVSSKKRPLNVTPEPTNKKIVLSEEDGPFRTPTNIRQLSSDSAITPSAKYSNRKNRGDVVTCNCDLSATNRSWSRQDVNRLVAVVNHETKQLKADCKYMFQRTSEKYYTLSLLISDMLQRFVDAGVVEVTASLSDVFQDPRVVIGRVNVDPVDKHLSLEEEVTGHTLPISLTSLNDYFMFPGQVVAAEGTNPSGKCLNALKLIDPIYPPPPPKGNVKDLSILVACGPFTTQDSIYYEPLNDLIGQIETNTPDLCILLGPFVDSEFAELQVHEDLESLQQNLFNKLKDMAASLNCHLVIVPSQKDFLHEYVYPQPPFKLSSNSFVSFLSDPCTIDVDGVIIGLTSTDVLMHISKETTSKSQTSTDRFTRLVQSLLGQHNYYPVYPPPAEVNVDLELFELYTKMSVTPHLLILPSELNCFIKTVNSCTCVNPGKLSKKEAGGTYARVTIRNLTSAGVGNAGVEINGGCNDEASKDINCDVKVVRI